MKTRFTFLLALLFAIAQGAWAITVINNEDDWNEFCNDVNKAINFYDNQTVRLNADITISTVVGGSTYSFQGTFDGGGHKITLKFGDPNDYLNKACAPFYDIWGATIKNLVIDGSIYSSAQYNASVAVRATANNNYIQNCISSVSIYSNRSDDCSNGGFIGFMNLNTGHVYFEGCAFVGQFVGANAYNWGGFVGWRVYEKYGYQNFVFFTDCLFAPTNINIATPNGSNSRTFCRSTDNTTDGATYTNSYYLTPLQATDGGKQAYRITGDNGIVVDHGGTVTTYNTSHISTSGPGIKYNGELYAGNGENVGLSINGPATRYIANNRVLVGSSSPYTLTMAAQDAVVKAWNVIPPIVINNSNDWETFQYVFTVGYDYNGEIVTLGTDDIEVSTIISSNNYPFRGTFDGGGHKLTLNFGNSSYSSQSCALFYRLDNATVKNLVIDGSIYSSAKNNASVAVTATGNNYINNCVSNVSIYSNRSDDCSNGGFIGVLNTQSTFVFFNGCAFTGDLVGTSATNWGGFVGWSEYQTGNRNYVRFTDCLFDPTNVSIAISEGTNSRTFCRTRDNDISGNKYTNCYYTKVLQAADGGKQAYSITAGEGVTSLENAGTATLYNYSGITSYGVGIKYNNVLYAGNSDNVSLHLEGSANNLYLTNNGVLTATSNPYNLAMTANNAVITAWNVTPPTEIATLDDWNNFYTSVKAGYDYAGKTVTMTANVGTTENPVNTIPYDNNHFFRGTFDGSGYTLTIRLGSSESYSDQECSPFYRLNNATIQNLVIDGSIYSSAQHNGGIAVRAVGNNNIIQNCVSNVSIHSNISGDCTNGGFIGILDSNGGRVSFNGCAFTGELVGASATNWGGFVGWRYYEYNSYNTVDFTDCLFAPATVNISNVGDSRPFCRSYNSTGASYTNSYYTEVLQGADGGNQPVIFTTAPGNIGEVKTTYGVSGITAYANGLEYGGRYYFVTEVINLANAADNSETINAKDGYYADVTLSDRTLYKDDDWNTLCLPFDVTLAGSPLAGAEARTLSEATFSDGTLTLDFGNPVTTLTAGTPYIIRWKPDLVIRTAADWEAFTKQLYSTNFEGKTVVLDADIVVTKMAGKYDDYRFRGTFDGRGHTLTFNTTAGEHQYTAPFYEVENATIINLHTAGTITTSRQYCSGLVGHAMGNTTIRNCWSSVNIISSVSGDGTHGGFVAMTHNANTSTTLIDCLFDGSITGTGTNSCGGLIGWNDCNATLTNCVFRPSDITLASGSNATFSRTRYNEKLVVNNCYYSQNLPGASGQGTAIGSMSNAELVAALGSGWTVDGDDVVLDMPKASADIVNPTFSGVIIDAEASTSVTPSGDGSVTFVGTYDPEELNGNSVLYLGTASKLYYPSTALTLNACRAYFQLNGIVAGDLPTQARAFVLNFGDDNETTAISDATRLNNKEKIKNNDWYTLDGRKLNGKPTKKGLYIVNGRKVMVK